jgi:NAD(P)-dependent dehydrogenase (short-subunit alcohol dehydrogenase family)
VPATTWAQLVTTASPKPWPPLLSPRSPIPPTKAPDLPCGYRNDVDGAIPTPAAPARYRQPRSRSTQKQVGTPRILVNTIGTFAMGEALSVTPQQFDELIAVNVGTALWLTQSVAPHMQQAGGGVIVHVTARPGIEPTPGYAGYGVSKAALVHLTKTLDLELRPHGIRVNAIAPQVIATAKNKALFPPEALVGAVEPEALADVIAFLVSDAAASINGAIVPTYGG